MRVRVPPPAPDHTAATSGGFLFGGSRLFVGAINTDTRAVLYSLAQRWQGSPVYVACSGNFTIERTLRAAGLTELHGNDVSLYSCYLGAYLSGRGIEIRQVTTEFAWLDEYLQPGIPTIATLLLCSQMFQFVGRAEPYHRRMFGAYRSKFPELHQATVERVTKVLEGMSLTSFTPGDALDFIDAAPEEAVVITYPPTYAGGYEKMYRVFDDVFEWEAPAYKEINEERYFEIVAALRRRPRWVLMTDKQIPGLTENLGAVMQTGLRSKPVLMYASEQVCRLTLPRQTIQDVPYRRLEGDIGPDLRLVTLSLGQMNSLRSQYLATNIIPAAPQVNLGLMSGECLVGALGFSPGNYGFDAYMMTDFAVRPRIYKHLSKLVVAAALSTEVKAVLEQRMNTRVNSIGTTAFTERAASMKYRGLFSVRSRKDGAVNYEAQAGRWTLEEALQWWLRNHAQKLT